MSLDPRQRYYVAADEAALRGDAAGVERAMRGAELCERSPEEWEIDRIWWSMLEESIASIDLGLRDPGPILVSPAVWRMLSGEFQATPAGRMELANLAAPFVTARDYVRVLETGSTRHLRPSRVPPNVLANRRRLDGRR